jgi:drug/metabolite transporter (DMT)-like permease
MNSGFDHGARTGILAAFAAAILFGASTPFAKQLVGDISSVLLAGLLYLGSGVGLWLFRLLRDRGFGAAPLRAGEWPWLLGAIGFGGVLAPALLMFGLQHVAAAHASLLLNLEAVLTAVLAWLVFRENVDRRIVFGMALIVAGGAALAWPAREVGHDDMVGLLAISAACLSWAIDNNLTRKVAASDAVFIAGTKGLVAGAINFALALSIGAKLPSSTVIASAMAIGLVGYGVSLVLFVVSLRHLGSARTGAYFSTAPFIGAVVAIAWLHEPTTLVFWIAAALMASGVWLHLTERHEHEHTHEPLTHAHAHRHDLHHQHEHDFPWDGKEPHAHEHTHGSMTHRHPHYPDAHHRHPH